MENKASCPRNTDDKRNAHFFARQGGSALLLAAFLLIAGPRHLWAQIAATATPTVLSFSPAQVGIPAASAQQLTVSFNVSGYTGSFTPTATLHYGYDYSAGTVGCTGTASPETCTVTITFQPTLPGARKDALLLMNGSTILTTVLLGGIGQAPLALVQPGVVTSPILGASYYIYNSTVDENGTVYFLATEQDAVYSVTKAGVVTQLPITGLSSPHGIAVDGAGTLYIAQNNYGGNVFTYTAGGVQGTITVQPPSPYVPCSNSNGGTLEYLYSTAVDDAGSLFTLEILCNQIFELSAGGTYTTTTISPVMIQPSQIAVDSSDDVFVSGYDINELTSGGTQTQINTVGAIEGLAVDAAGTLYATRYTGGGVAELPASSYATSLANLDPAASPLGASLGSDGTLYVGNYNDLDKVDRSQGTIAFGEQSVGVTSTAQDVGIYNGGNEPLTLSNIALTGSAFALGAAPADECTDGLVLPPGSLCQVAVTMTAPNAGTFSGTLTFTTNSQNTTSTLANVALSGYVYGPYVTASPSSLVFPPLNPGSTSAAQIVTLTNNGDLYAAGLGAPVPPSSAFKVTLCSNYNSIAVGASCQASVTFSPTADQVYSGTVTIPVASGGGGSWPSVTFTVRGTGGIPVAGASPSSLTFGSQNVGTTSASQPVALSNTGTGTLTIASIAPSANFGESDNCAGIVVAGGSCTLNVTFSPTATGALSGTLTITDDSNGVEGSTQTVNLSGTLLAPSSLSIAEVIHVTDTLPPAASLLALPLSIAEVIHVTDTEPPVASLLALQLPIAEVIHVTDTEPPAASLLALPLSIAEVIHVNDQVTIGPNVSLSPSSLTFPAQIIGTSSRPRTVTLTNTGTVTLVINAIEASGDFSQTNDCGSAVSAEASCTISVTFKPTKAGTRTGALSISDNATGGPRTVALSGTGVATAAGPPPPPAVSLAPSSLTFSGQIVGTSSRAQTVKLTNTGSVSVTISRITISGDFSQTNTCRTILIAGANCTISVTFKPESAGTRTGALSISDNATGSPQTAELSGTGEPVVRRPGPFDLLPRPEPIPISLQPKP